MHTKGLSLLLSHCISTMGPYFILHFMVMLLEQWQNLRKILKIEIKELMLLRININQTDIFHTKK